MLTRKMVFTTFLALGFANPAPVLSAQDMKDGTFLLAELGEGLEKAQGSARELDVEDALWVRELRFDARDLLAAKSSESPHPVGLEIDLGYGDYHRFAGVDLQHGLDATTWIGGFTGSGADQGNAMITFGDEGVYGVIAHDGRDYRIRSDKSGRPYLMEIDTAVFPLGDCASPEHASVDAAGGSRNPAFEFLGSPFAKAGTDLCLQNDPPPPARTLDILVLHTPAVPDPLMQANNLIASLNFVLSNSGITAQANLLGVSQIVANEVGRHHGTIQKELFCAAGDGDSPDPTRRQLCRSGLFDNDLNLGRMDEVFATRDAAGADLVVLLVRQVLTSKETCGVANIPLPALDNAGPAVGQDLSPMAYGVVGDSCAGTDFTFVHEVGHLLGGIHEWHDDNNQQGGGMFGYSRGYMTPGGVRDIMAGEDCTITSPCPRQPLFSDPDRMINGERMGHRLELNGNLNPSSGICRQRFGNNFGDCHADAQCAIQRYATTVEGYRASIGGGGEPELPPPPGAVASVQVSCPTYYLPGYNQVTIAPPATGIVEYYSVALRRVRYGDGSWQQYYSGPSANPLVRVMTQSYLRARACNSGGCGPAVQSPTLAGSLACQ